MSEYTNVSLFDVVEPEVVPDVCPTCRRPFLSDEGQVGRHHPETSRDAARRPGKRSEGVRVLRWLRAYGPANAGVVAEALGRSPNQIATRLLELRRAGLAERLRGEDGEWVTALTPTGSSGIVHVVTEAATVYLDELG